MFSTSLPPNPMDSLPIAVVSLDDDGRVFGLNHEAKALLPDEPTSLKALSPLTEHDVTDEIIGALQRSGRWEGELKGAGVERPARLWARLTRASESDAQPYLGVIDEREDYFDLKDQLTESEKMRTIGRLAGGIAHNLNNSMVGVLGYASLLSARATGDDRLVKYADNIITASQRAADLIQQFLSFGVHGDPHPVMLCLGDVAEIAAKLYSKSYPARVTLDFCIQPNLPHIYASPLELQQFFHSLFLYFQDQARDGALQMTLEATLIRELDPESNPAGVDEAIEVTLTATSDHPMRSTVQQIGALTPAAGKDILFFHEVLNKHKGWASIEAIQDNDRSGARLHVFIPPLQALKKKRGEAGTEAGAVKPRLHENAIQVLVIDDEEMVRDLVGDLLHDKGYAVAMAHNGLKGIEMAGTQPFALVILDWSLPDIDGLDVYDRLRETQPTLPILVSSGHSIEEIRSEMPKDDPHLGFVQKPYHFMEFLQTAAALLRESQDL